MAKGIVYAIDTLFKKKKTPRNLTPDVILERQTTGKYIGDIVYGANDGIITTFAIVAGAVGASLSPSIIIILGMANIIADGISMGASNYLGKKSELDYAKHQEARERYEIENSRETEIQEIREIFLRKGFAGKDLDKAVEIITKDKEVWVDTMMKEELGLIKDNDDDALKHGIATFLAFVIAGLIPLTSYLIPVFPNSFLISIIIGGITLFVIGALRSFVTTVSFLAGGLEMLLIGAVSSSAAYFISSYVESLLR